MDIKVVCWDRRHVTTLKRMLSRMGQFPQLEPVKKHIFFMTPQVGAENVVCGVLNDYVKNGMILKYVVWDYRLTNKAPDEDLPLIGNPNVMDDGDPFEEDGA